MREVDAEMSEFQRSLERTTTRCASTVASPIPGSPSHQQFAWPRSLTPQRGRCFPPSLGSMSGLHGGCDAAVVRDASTDNSVGVNDRGRASISQELMHDIHSMGFVIPI